MTMIRANRRALSLPVAVVTAAVLACNTLFTPAPSGAIVFTSERNGDLEIYTMDADGQNQTRLTDNPGYDQGPVWSPDGARIAYHSWNGRDLELWVMDADGSNKTQLTNSPGDDWRRR